MDFIIFGFVFDDVDVGGVFENVIIFVGFDVVDEL